MLNKIINITPGSDYKHSGNPSGMQGDNSKNASNSGNLSDSVELSSAIKFLMQIGWKLRKFKHYPGEKIELVFFYSDIEFQTIIDLSNPNFPSKFDYVLRKDKPLQDEIKYIEIFLSSVLINTKSTSGKPSELTELNNFLDTLFTLALEGKDLPKNFSLNEFSKEFENIYSEINYLNNYLLLFIEKITETKITIKNPEVGTNELLVIDRAKIS